MRLGRNGGSGLAAATRTKPMVFRNPPCLDLGKRKRAVDRRATLSPKGLLERLLIRRSGFD